VIPAHTIGFLQNQWILIMPYGPCRFRHPKHLFDVFSVGQSAMLMLQSPLAQLANESHSHPSASDIEYH
jgi:hypothetical protein